MFSKKVALVAAIAVVAVVGTVCVFSPETVGFRFRVLPHFKGPVDAAWTNWKVQHGKTYGGPEDKARYQVFKNNFKIVQEHNAKGRSFTMALNQFADLTNKEFAALYTGSSTTFLNGTNACPAPSEAGKLTRMYAPESLDWRTKGRVGAVKNQQQCGSCWAFSTTGSLEGLNAKQTGQPGSFSEQELVDCSTGYGNFGCGGGWVQNAFHYVLDNGIANETDYTYSGTDDTCRNSSAPRAFKISGCANVATNSVEALKQALQNGPVSVYVEADQSSFQLYNSGVVDDASCFTEGQIDHAVLAVGYTANSWIVKNSWGPSWGDQGYIQISNEVKTDARGICGILSTPNTYPL